MDLVSFCLVLLWVLGLLAVTVMLLTAVVRSVLWLLIWFTVWYKY